MKEVLTQVELNITKYNEIRTLYKLFLVQMGILFHAK